MSTYPDISHHHPVGDWERVADSCPFIITKATQGTSFVDSAMAGIVRQCEKRGIPYWLYVYLNKGDELAQTKFMVKTCESKVGKHFMGYILDVEAGNTAAGVQKAMDYLKTLPHKMMLYTMYSQYDRYKNVIKKRPEKCAWWEARYGANDGVYRSKYPCHDGVDLHQFTSNGVCPGISDRIDLNRITGQGKSEKWFMTPKEEKEDDKVEKREGCFAPVKSPETCDSIEEFLKKRDFKSGEHNLRLIVAENAKKGPVKDALLLLAKEGRLKKPDGLNKRDS